jgi:hypothetical protein
MSDIKEELKQNFAQNKNLDFGKGVPEVDESVVLHEHEGTPRSYMVFNNLKNIIIEASELLSIMNQDDELPAWTQEMISSAKMNVSKSLDYVRAEKSE